MSKNFAEPILPEDFVSDILSEISNEVYYVREEQPDYAAFSEEKEKWYQTMEQLDKAVIEEYDNLVLQAFSDYQRALENNMVGKGIMSAISRRLQGAEDLCSKGGSSSELAEAEERLDKVCEQFTGRLEGETASQCAAFLKLRREVIDAGHDLCRQCGAELAEGLLTLTGI